MSNKSKAYVKETPMVSAEYVEGINMLINAMNLMFNNTSNQISEIYRLSQLVSFFAGQKCYLDLLREQFSQAKQNKDYQMMKQILFRVENSYECKVFDDHWQEIADMYDNMIESIAQQDNREGVENMFKTASEILESRRKYYMEKTNAEFEENCKTIAFCLGI